MLIDYCPNIYTVQKGYRQKVRGARMKLFGQKLLDKIPKDEIVDVEPLYNQKFLRKARLTDSWEKRNFQGPLVLYPNGKVCS